MRWSMEGAPGLDLERWESTNLKRGKEQGGEAASATPQVVESPLKIKDF
jgi:hypothetical protein